MEKCPFCGSEDIYFSKKRKLFVCEDCDGIAEEYVVKLDEESSNYIWVSLEEVLSLPLADSQRRRLVDVISYIRTGQKSIG